jgi:hypothetical protein
MLPAMLIEELIGKTIQDIRVKIEVEAYGLDKADVYVILDNDLIVGVPFTIEPAEQVWMRPLDNAAQSIVTRTNIFGRSRDARTASPRGKKIVDLLSYLHCEDRDHIEAARPFIQLENGPLITEINVAPHGTGLAGLVLFNSLDELEKRHGSNYRRFTRMSRKGTA